MRNGTAFLAFGLSVAGFVLAACSSTDTGTNGQSGGASGSAGQGTGGFSGAAGTSGSLNGGAAGTSGSLNGGATGTGGNPGTGGAPGSGGAIGTGGSSGAGGSGGSAAGSGGKGGADASSGSGGKGGIDAAGPDSSTTACDAPSLVWKTGSKTEYTSYPDPGSEECIKYSGCQYMGMFAACNNTATEAWVAAHNIVAAFPDFNTLKLHDLCLKSGTKTIIVTVIDTCGDSDCGGCCTANKGTADELIDVESYTAARWGVPDGRIQWADLGLTKGQACP
jgi:hypothetical protein